MNLKNLLLPFLARAAGTKTGPSAGLNKAVRAGELNGAISTLWQAQGTHSKADFQSQVMPMYTKLLEALKQSQPVEVAEQTLINLLDATTAACRHRWTIRLPMKRPGSDYRKYEMIYTDALVTAMAVGCLAAQRDTGSPEQLARHILTQEGIARLKADPMVWEDWLGYFQQAELGGLYGTSVCAQPVKQRRANRQQQPAIARSPPTPPPAGSGRAMLEAIRKALADGSLSFNQPDDAVQVDRQGRTFLEHPKILKWCIEQLALDDDLKRAKGRFSRLKIHKRSEKGHQLYHGRLGKHDRRRLGYVLENPAVLWSEAPPMGQFEIEQVTDRQN